MRVILTKVQARLRRLVLSDWRYMSYYQLQNKKLVCLRLIRQGKTSVWRKKDRSKIVRRAYRDLSKDPACLAKSLSLPVAADRFSFFPCRWKHRRCAFFFSSVSRFSSFGRLQAALFPCVRAPTCARVASSGSLENRTKENSIDV